MDNEITDLITAAEDAMGIPADHTIDLSGLDFTKHRHVAIHWAGGVLWLDMSDRNDHYCIDVRQFDSKQCVRQPMGVFGIQGGRRVDLDDSNVPPGQRKLVHGWPAISMPILLTDKK